MKSEDEYVIQVWSAIELSHIFNITQNDLNLKKILTEFKNPTN